MTIETALLGHMRPVDQPRYQDHDDGVLTSTRLGMRQETSVRGVPLKLARRH